MLRPPVGDYFFSSLLEPREGLIDSPAVTTLQVMKSTMDSVRGRAWWPRLAREGVVAVLIASAGCIAEPEPSDDDGAEASTTGSDLPGASESDPDATVTETGSSESGASETGSTEVPWSDVPCGEVTCAGTDLCVERAGYCSTSPCEMGMDAVWVEPPPECEPFPAGCDPADPVSCLRAEYCPTEDVVELDDGYMTCFPTPGDCWCS